MGALVLVTAPAAEPVTLAEAKAHCRVTHSDDDTRFNALIVTAREWAQGFTGRAFITQTWDYYLDEFPDQIELPLSPLASVSTIEYTDDAGVVQTLSALRYQVDTRSIVPRISPAYGDSWPSTREVYNAVKVRFVAGYGAAVTAHPDCARARDAMLLHIEAHYDRDQQAVKGLMEAAESLLRPLRIMSF